jgi:hypothetical protein
MVYMHIAYSKTFVLLFCFVPKRGMKENRDWAKNSIGIMVRVRVLGNG